MSSSPVHAESSIFPTKWNVVEFDHGGPFLVSTIDYSEAPTLDAFETFPFVVASYEYPFHYSEAPEFM